MGPLPQTLTLAHQVKRNSEDYEEKRFASKLQVHMEWYLELQLPNQLQLPIPRCPTWA